MKLQFSIIAFLIVFSQLSFAQKPKEGKYTFKDGSIYNGQLINKIPNGKGKTTFKTGDTYEGEYRDGKRQGEGTYSFTDGEKYVGSWVNDHQHGHGLYVFSNGNKYEGLWYTDYQEGQGTMYYHNGDKYVGDWHQDMREGEGVYTWSNGAFYRGSWARDKKNGKGLFDWADGSTYYGDMKDDVREGYGSYNYANGDVYKGQWKNDMMDGKGIYTFKNGDKYEGEYVAGKRQGQGIFTYVDGNRYMGTFKNGLMDGSGTYTWADGSVYEGEWSEGLQHGHGKYTTSKGVTYETEWQKGEPKEKIILNVPNETEPIVENEKEASEQEIWEYIHQISYNKNLVSEKTKDEAFEAPISLLTGKRWVFNHELSRPLNYPYIFETFHSPQSGMITFKADYTFTTERIIKNLWAIWKVTYSGEWRRYKNEFISMKPNPSTVKVQCIEYYSTPYQQLSARLKSNVNDEVRKHIESIQKEIRHRQSQNRTNSYTHKLEKNPDYIKYPDDAKERMERLDHEFLVLDGDTYVNEAKLREIYERRPKLSKKEPLEETEINLPVKHTTQEIVPNPSTY